MSPSSRPLNLLVFYMVNERHRETDTEQLLGYIRIADIDKRKTIEKIEVSEVSETFNFLREKLSKMAKPCERNDLPESDQCFAIVWDEELSSKLKAADCPFCKEIDYHVRNYKCFLTQSKRFAAVR